MVKRKLIPAIEVAFITTVMGTVGGILVGAGGVALFLRPAAVPSWLLVMIVFFGVFFVVAAITNAIIHDERMTRMEKSVIPLSREEIEGRLRQRAKEKV